jgi:hypothetical protein
MLNKTRRQDLSENLKRLGGTRGGEEEEKQ